MPSDLRVIWDRAELEAVESEQIRVLPVNIALKQQDWPVSSFKRLA